MVTDKIKVLSAARAKVAALEASIAAELKSELAALPAEYGFESTAAFIAAVRAASAKPRGRKPGRPTATAAAKRRKRAVITDAIRAKVKQMVNGGKTGAEIAKSLGISVPSVQNIKKALGLVKERT